MQSTKSTEVRQNPMDFLRNIAKAMHLGPLALRVYHRPLARIAQSIAEGGPLEQRRTERARREMVVAAESLSPLIAPDGEASVEVSFLSGKNFWWQTLFCVLSLQTHSPIRVVPVVYDDGTLDESIWFAFSRVVPWARLITAAESETQLDAHLPSTRFPVLRSRRLNYPHLRKLTDVRAGRVGWTVVLDSDMLVFRRPQALLNWLVAPDRPCCLVEHSSFYGYSPKLMHELAGGEPPPRVNVGICGLRSDAIDWERLEYWCREMLEREGAHYLQEQALTAMLLTHQVCLRLEAPDYIVMPSVEEGRSPSAALHHYVSSSKRSYFQHGWRRSLVEARNLSTVGSHSSA